MIPGARLIILGRQGAGKGTQCIRLSRHYVVPHISTGDILRAAVQEGTELGKQAKAIMDAGGLVPDDVMIGIVDERLGTAATPRPAATCSTASPGRWPRPKALGELTMQRAPIDVVIDLDVPRELVLDRLSRRRVCTDCGTNYIGHRAGAPAVDLRHLRRRRRPARRRHARGDQPPARPVREPDRRR